MCQHMESVCIVGVNSVDAWEHGLPASAAVVLTTLIKLSLKVMQESIKNLVDI